MTEAEWRELEVTLAGAHLAGVRSHLVDLLATSIKDRNDSLSTLWNQMTYEHIINKFKQYGVDCRVEWSNIEYEYVARCGQYRCTGSQPMLCLLAVAVRFLTDQAIDNQKGN